MVDRRHLCATFASFFDAKGASLLCIDKKKENTGEDGRARQRMHAREKIQRILVGEHLFF